MYQTAKKLPQNEPAILMYGLVPDALGNVTFPDIQDRLTTDGHEAYMGCIKRHNNCPYAATITNTLRFKQLLSWLQRMESDGVSEGCYVCS